jgi:hypothetical protein
MHQWKIACPRHWFEGKKQKHKQQKKNAPSVTLRVSLVRFKFREVVGCSICESCGALLLALSG